MAFEWGLENFPYKGGITKRGGWFKKGGDVPYWGLIYQNENYFLKMNK